jgi:hypothetical protein
MIFLEWRYLARSILKVVALAVRKGVMRRRGRQVVLDLARLRLDSDLMNVGRWCKSAFRRNLLKAFKILGQPELC